MGHGGSRSISGNPVVGTGADDSVEKGSSERVKVLIGGMLKVSMSSSESELGEGESEMETFVELSAVLVYVGACHRFQLVVGVFMAGDLPVEWVNCLTIRDMRSVKTDSLEAVGDGLVVVVCRVRHHVPKCDCWTAAKAWVTASTVALSWSWSISTCLSRRFSFAC